MHTSRLNDAVGLELAAIVRPSGGIVLFGQVLTRNVFAELRGEVHLWTRWAEPEETGLERARIDIAAATRLDVAARTARVIARATPTSRRYVRGVYDILEVQGMIDLLVVGPAAPDGSPSELVHVLACAELTRRSTSYELSAAPFPKHYL